MVHAWDVPAAYTWDTATIGGVHDQWQQLACRRLDTVADQWERKHPEVHVHDKLRQEHPVFALLDAQHRPARTSHLRRIFGLRP